MADVITQEDLTQLSRNITFWNEWLSTSADNILNPATGQMVQSFKRVANIGATFALNEVHRRNVDLLANIVGGTGWTIPESGLFRIDISNTAGQGWTYIGDIVSAADLRAMPVVTVNSQRTSIRNTIRYNVGSDRGFTDYIFARTSTNELVMLTNDNRQDPAPLTIKQVVLTS